MRAGTYEGNRIYSYLSFPHSYFFHFSTFSDWCGLIFWQALVLETLLGAAPRSEITIALSNLSPPSNRSRWGWGCWWRHLSPLPAENDDDDGVGDDGDAGEDGHDDAKEGVDEVERPVELGGVHQVAGCYIGAQTRDPEDDCYNDDAALYVMMMRPSAYVH